MSDLCVKYSWLRQDCGCELNCDRAMMLMLFIDDTVYSVVAELRMIQ